MSHHETTESQSSGSTRSSRNAVKHGLTSSNFCLLADEDAQLFNDYRSSIEQALAPRNVIEAIHVARIVESTWMIFRASLMEAKAISVQMDTTKQRLLAAPTAPTSDAATHLQLLGGEYLCCRAIEELDAQSNLLEKLNRYRTTQERSFHRCLNALQKLRGPGRPLLEALPPTCHQILNGQATLFAVKPPSTQIPGNTPHNQICETKPNPNDAPLLFP